MVTVGTECPMLGKRRDPEQDRAGHPSLVCFPGSPAVRKGWPQALPLYHQDVQGCGPHSLLHSKGWQPSPHQPQACRVHGLCLSSFTACHQRGWEHTSGSSHQHRYDCSDSYYSLRACVCQALCFPYLNALRNPAKSPASWWGLCLPPFLEHFLGPRKPRVAKLCAGRCARLGGCHTYYYPESWQPTS